MYLHVQKWTSVKLDLFRGCVAGGRKEETSLMFSGKEVDFARSLWDKLHEFNVH